MQSSRLLVTVMVAFSVSGCASMKAAQRAQDAAEKRASCQARWQALVPKQEAASNEFMEKSGLRAKIPQNFLTMTYEQRTNPDRANEVERQNLEKVIDMRRQANLDRTGLLMDCMSREELAVYKERNSADTSDFQDLRNRRITFGEFLQSVDARQKKYQSDLKAAAATANRRGSSDEAYRAEQDRATDAQTVAAFAAGLQAAGAAMAEASHCCGEPAYRRNSARHNSASHSAVHVLHTAWQPYELPKLLMHASVIEYSKNSSDRNPTKG